jgi:hypothetical protein
MNQVKTRTEADALLKEIKERIKISGLLVLNDRPNNAQTLADLDITPQMQKEIINSLSTADYCAGPAEDHKYPWKWVALFGKKYNGIELYIKFSVGIEGTAVTCLSFHKAGSPMEYQFK